MSNTNQSAGTPVTVFSFDSGGTAQAVGSVYPLPSIKPEHLRIHEGKAFLHANNHSVTNTSTYDHLLITGSTVTTHLRLFEVSATGSPMTIDLYEGTTVSANGSAGLVTNLNRGSSTSNVTALYEGPTVTAAGTLITEFLITGGKQEGGLGQYAEEEVMLKASTNYLLRVTNNSGQTQTICTILFFYEV